MERERELSNLSTRLDKKPKSADETTAKSPGVSPGWIETKDYAGLRRKDHAQHPAGRGADRKTRPNWSAGSLTASDPALLPAPTPSSTAA
jgi:hypothetical protein